MRRAHFEIPVEVDVDGEVVSATAMVEVTGDYRPATWGYHGGDPPEYPEADVVELIADDGRTLAIDLLTEAQCERIAERAIERRDELEERPDDEPPEDAYWPDDDTC